MQPGTGEPATTVASTILTAQRKQKAVNDAVETLRTAAKANISYGGDYAPPAASEAK